MEEHNLTFVEALEANRAHCLAEGMSLSTVDNKDCNIGLFIKWALAQEVASPLEVAKKLGEQYKVYLTDYISPQTGKVLKKSTRRKHVSDVRVFFKELTYLELLDSNPLEQLRLPKSPRPTVTALMSVKQIERVMGQTKQLGFVGLRDRAILECYYATAGRRNEIGRLTLADIKMENEQVLIIDGKGDKSRYVPFAERPASWLTAYLNEARPKLANLKSGTTLFLDNKGLPFRPHQLTALVKKYLNKAGISVGAACNAFRHSAATHMLEQGADIREIQEYLGHADLSTTQVYVHVVQAQLKKVYKQTHPAAKGRKVTQQELKDYRHA